jgi:hypothetical protein
MFQLLHLRTRANYFCLNLSSFNIYDISPQKFKSTNTTFHSGILDKNFLKTENTLQSTDLPKFIRIGHHPKARVQKTEQQTLFRQL